MRRRYADSVLTSLGLRKAHGPTTTRTGRPIRPDSRLRDVYKRRERRTGWGEGAEKKLFLATKNARTVSNVW